MINAIIFDFGDVFINLEKEAVTKAFKELGLKEWSQDLDELNSKFEIGKISEIQFIEGFQKHLPNASVDEIRKAWNAVLGDFPLYRLEFLQNLKGKYRLFLLSNTDAIHIEKFEHKVGISFARDFYQCFEKVYFSFEVGMRKPTEDIFKFVIQKQGLQPNKTLFIDDRKDNTDTAEKLGMVVWNLNPNEEDVVDLFDKKF
ncbi:HAD family hydrolase [Flavobacterium orientale]|uniref:Haloacid dehalogenase n=1 Tax=Flavobacterium orientale TaxID=1756020 RepID=A0A916Y3V2_9FLAO|nr:HAD family phosphatase [Flavobacterium orientale]GGD29943.1 haloacid dehalogenase [Flavobacterium orientale]